MRSTSLLPRIHRRISELALGLIIICIPISACGNSPGATEPPTFKVSVEGDGNTHKLKQTDGTTILEIYSESGIGSGTVQLISGTPPETIVLRLYLRGLEQFQLSYEDTVIRASVSSNDSGRASQSLVSNGSEQSISASSPFWMDIKIVTDAPPPVIPLEDGHFEITLPGDYLQKPDRPFTLEWIDFFR